MKLRYTALGSYVMTFTAW